MAYSKIILNGETLMDVTSDTVDAGNLLSGKTATKNSGVKVTGNIASKSSSDLTVSGATITAPSGYYSASASKSIASGTEGTPTATKGAVSNHAVTVTPSVTNVGGYIQGGTKTGTAVSVSASELVSGTKTITQNGTSIDVANYEKATVNVSAPSPSLQSKTYNVSSAGTETVTADSGYDGLSEVEVAVPSGSLVSSIEYTDDEPSITVDNNGLVHVSGGFSSTVNPVTASGYIGSASTIEVDVGAVGTYQLTKRTSSDLTVSGATVTAPTGYYPSSATKTIATGTAGTPTASKGTVSNHSVSVTPSVTNTTGYITGGTKTGTAVSVSASELVSGNLPITQNGNNIDCANYSTVSVNVSGGGGSSMQIDTIGPPSSITTSTMTFTGLSGEPTSFMVYADDVISTSASPKVAAVVFDGTSLHGQIVTNTSNAQASYDTGFTKSYSNGTLTITSTNASFISVEHYLTYTYGGGAVDTKDVQVGSGATSITFTGLEDEPVLWSCIFKSNFSTSSGYQRVMAVGETANGTIVGFAMDSSAHANSAYWTASYNNGSFTISSQGTNTGGYFHQPGYYQLTYAYDNGSSGNYQSKTVTPTTSQQVVEADSGYDALEKVTVNAMPTMTLPSATSATSSGTSKATITPSSSAQYLNIPTGYNGTAQYYTISASGGGSPTLQNKTVNPTTSQQSVTADVGYDGLGTVTVTAMPSGTAGTPTASKGTVSNHAVTVTPSVTNITGYITGGTLTGTGVSVSASELVSGNKSIIANGNNIDVADYSTVSVNVPTGGGASNLVQGTFTTSATEGTTQTVNIPYTGNGYPISLSVFPSEGTYKNGGTAYNTVKQYAVWYFNASKCYPDTAPTYDGSNTKDTAMTLVRYKNSSSSSSNMGSSSVNNTTVYNQTSGNASAAQVIKISSATTLSVLTASTTYGLLPSTEYTYVMSYSS